MVNVNVAKTLMLLIVVLFASNGYASTVYKWVDRSGAVGFSDDYNNIPQEYRNQTQIELLEDYPSVQPPALPAATSTPSQKMEGPKTDIYGMGPDYWKDRVSSWQQKIKESQDNIRAVNAKIEERINALSGRFLSNTQYNMNSIQLQALRAERAKYEAQENEAKEMLQKISKEAEEAKADLSWLN
jgi:hypothetical protein